MSVRRESGEPHSHQRSEFRDSDSPRDHHRRQGSHDNPAEQGLAGGTTLGKIVVELGLEVERKERKPGAKKDHSRTVARRSSRNASRLARK
jgi:hypothetical protein